jgi:hypothetical protein
MPVGCVLLTSILTRSASTERSSNRNPNKLGNRKLVSMATSVSSLRRAYLLFQLFVLAATQGQITNIAEEPNQPPADSAVFTIVKETVVVLTVRHGAQDRLNPDDF